MNTAYLLRKERDSNPRYGQSRTADFESAPFDHSGIFPLTAAKIATFLNPAKHKAFFQCNGRYSSRPAGKMYVK